MKTPDLLPPGGRFSRAGLGYALDTANDKGEAYGVRLSMDYLVGKEGSYAGELLVKRTNGEHIHRSRLVLANLRDRMSMTGFLEARSRKANIEIPWGEVLEVFCTKVLDAEREGFPFERVGRSIEKRVRPRDLVARILPTGKPVTWYGKGDTGKGWITVATAVVVAKGLKLAGLETDGNEREVLYLDWEDSAQTLEERVQAVCEGLGLKPEDRPLLHYRRMNAPLQNGINEVVYYVRENKIAFVIVDSVEMAMGDGESGFGSGGIKGLYRAIRHLEPATVLLIDHIKAMGQDAEDSGKLAGKAFGSSYKMYEARAAWELTKEQHEESNEQVVSWVHTKHNHTSRFRPIGMRLTFKGEEGQAPDEVRIERADIAETEVLSKQLSLPDRIAAALRFGPKSAAQLVDDLGMDGKNADAQMRNALNRGNGNRFIKLPDGRWALLDKPLPTPHITQGHMNGLVPAGSEDDDNVPF